MAVNYTEEQVAVMIEKYSNNPTRETVEFLAQEMDKSIKSIIGKLSREGVYKKTEYEGTISKETRNYSYRSCSEKCCYRIFSEKTRD